MVLFLIFFSVLVIFTAFVWSSRIPIPLTNLAAIGLLYTALSCAYVQVYPASQADSPSFRILLLVEQAGKDGLAEDKIRTFLTTKTLLDDRINDLLLSKLIHESAEGALSLTQKGKILILPFLILRNLIGLPKGAG